MHYSTSYLLAVLRGNASPSATDGLGIEADNDRFSKVVSELNGKTTEDVIAQGMGKLARGPANRAVAASSASGSAAPAEGLGPAATEKKDKKKGESDDDRLGLFD